MSTYLVAFVVSDFTYINTKDKKGVLVVPPHIRYICNTDKNYKPFVTFLFSLSKVRIWARKKAIEEGQGNYALNITQPILEFFEKYYNTSYPLSKSGMVGFIQLGDYL